MKGFTLLEILVTLSLLMLLTILGVSVSLGNIQKNVVSETGSDIRSMMIQARDYSLAGRKIACTSTLLGWQVDINNSTKQSVLSEVCDSVIPFLTKKFSSSLSITFSGSSSVRFSTVTGGTNINSISIITISNSYGSTVVTVDPGGLVQ